MARFMIARLLSSVVLFFAITLFVFVTFFVLPANSGTPRRPGRIAGNFIVRDTYWIHGSMIHQYSRYVWNLVRHGDLGRSYVNRQPVVDQLKPAAPVTFSLMLGGVFIWLLISIPLGILSALRPRSLLDRASTVFVFAGLAAHPVWLGLVIFIESVFSLPGLGGTFRTSLLQRDLPMTAGIVIFMTVAIMLLNLLVDLSYAFLDPRIRTRPSGIRAEIPAVGELVPAPPLELELPA